MAGLVDDMIEDSDPGAEHTWAQTSNQHPAAGLYLDQQTDRRTLFSTVGPSLTDWGLTVDMETLFRHKVDLKT